MKLVSIFTIVAVLISVTRANPVTKFYNRPEQQANRQYFNLADGSSVVRVVEGNVYFHAFKQPNKTYTVNIVELPTQLMVIDFGVFVSDSQKAVNYARSLGKSSISCYLTHEHPDHFGGYDAWKDACTRTFALSEIITSVNSFLSFPNDFQASARSFLNNVQPIQLGRQRIGCVNVDFERVVDVETPFFLFIRMPDQKAMFVGDLANVNNHFYLADNRDISKFFHFLYRTKRYAYRNVFMGHAFPADFTKNKVFTQDIDYLTFVRDIANTYKNGTEYVSQILNRFSTYTSSDIVGAPFGL